MSPVIQNPIITRTERTGYAHPPIIREWQPKNFNVCDVCDEYEAEVKLHRTKLCSGCASEEGIELL